jgi:hypothetical protein
MTLIEQPFSTFRDFQSACQGPIQGLSFCAGDLLIADAGS